MHRSPILAYFFELSRMSGQTFAVTKPLQVKSVGESDQTLSRRPDQAALEVGPQDF